MALGKRGEKPPKEPASALKRPSDADRDARMFEIAVRRVPAWQVSVTNALMRIAAGEADYQTTKVNVARILAQVPPEVLRAVELQREKWDEYGR